MLPDEWFSCRRKVRYGHKSTAERAVKAMRTKSEARKDLKAYEKDLEAYECDYCGGWHIGRKRSGNLRQLRLFP